MRAFLPGIALFAVCAIVARAQDLSARFYEAIRNDNTVELQKLIRASGANVKDQRGTTPLMYAAATGSLGAMKMLVDEGADVNAKNAFNITALMWCATDEAKVRLLLAKNADPAARSKQGRTPLLIAAGTEGSAGILKLLFDKGAKIKDADVDPVTTPLSAAAGANDEASLRLLLDNGAETAGPAGAFALMSAAGHGNVGMMRMLVDRGVPVDAVSPPVTETVKNGNIALGSFTPLILAAAYGGPDAVRFLLDRKANVNVQDVRGMTPLMLSLALDHPDPRVARLLLERGADPKIKSKAGETAADWARKFNRPELLQALNVPANPVRVAFNENPLPVAEVARKSADLLQRTTAKFFVEGGCSSCHAHNMTAMALEAVRGAGIKVNEPAALVGAQQTKAYWSPQEQTLMLRMDVPGGQIMTSFGLLEFASEAVKPNPTTDAMVHNIAAQQQLNGCWHDDGIARPPMADGDFTRTAVAIRSLALYGAPGRRVEFASRIANAAACLRKLVPVTAEDYDMQMMGLKWAGAVGELPRLARAISSMQRPDGGWAQSPWLASDAYATGLTLVALRGSGLNTGDPAYRRGVDFLLRTQMADGSWHVSSRSPKFQPYFQSGFPFDHDQWISMAGTAWATMALAYAAPQAKMTASK